MKNTLPFPSNNIIHGNEFLLKGNFFIENIFCQFPGLCYIEQRGSITNQVTQTYRQLGYLLANDLLYHKPSEGICISLQLGVVHL